MQSLVNSFYKEINSSNLRLKNAQIEGDKTYADWRVEGFDTNGGQFSATAYNTFEEAAAAARNYSVETAVWTLSDGSAVLISDRYATSTEMTVPIGVGVGSIAHYHPSGDGQLSTTDLAAFESWHNAGINTAVIITDDGVYSYYYGYF